MGTVLRRTLISASAIFSGARALRAPAREGLRSLTSASLVTPHQAQSGGGRGHGHRHAVDSKLFLLGGAAVTAGLAYGHQNRLHFSAGAEGAEGAGFADTALYQQTEPIQSGKIKVSDIHTIAFTVYGNPQGKPVLFVHGGPGGGTTPAMARFSILPSTRWSWWISVDAAIVHLLQSWKKILLGTLSQISKRFATCSR